MCASLLATRGPDYLRHLYPTPEWDGLVAGLIQARACWFPVELRRLLANHGSQAHLFETFPVATVFFALVELNKIVVTFTVFFCFHVCSPRPLLGRLSSAAADSPSPLRCGLQVPCWKDKCCKDVPCALLSFLPVYPRCLCDTSFTSILSDIFSKTLHRKLPGRKFPFHVRISLAIPEPAGAFSLPGYHLFDTSSVLSWQWWAQSVGGSLLWEQSPGKVITGSEACVQSTGVRDLCAASLMF